MKKIALFLSLLSMFAVSAVTPKSDGFKKHFKLKKDKNGNVIQIIDESLMSSFAIAPYLKFIKNAIKTEQKLIANKEDYDQRVFDLLNVNTSQKDADEIEKVRVVVASLKKLQGINVDKIFQSKAMNNLLARFEGRLSNVLASLDPRVIADLNQSDFFYKRNVTYKIVNWALNYAKKKFSTIPVLNTASFIIVKVEEMIRKKRLFHQNMLLHYLENFPASELGMTHSEVNHAISSIYESRIEWYAYGESKAAVKTWDKYGIDKFFVNLRSANTRLRHSGANMRNGRRINFAFQEANVNGEHVILNLFNTANSYNQSLAIAYYFDKPGKVKKQRMILQLAQFGLSYVTIPNWLKGMAENYIKSFYKTQELTEGSLMGYFETINDQAGMNLVRAQYLNPFDQI